MRSELTASAAPTLLFRGEFGAPEQLVGPRLVAGGVEAQRIGQQAVQAARAALEAMVRFAIKRRHVTLRQARAVEGVADGAPPKDLVVLVAIDQHAVLGDATDVHD